MQKYIPLGQLSTPIRDALILVSIDRKDSQKFTSSFELATNLLRQLIADLAISPDSP